MPNSTLRGQASTPVISTDVGAPDPLKIQAQLAALAEAGEWRPFLDYLRILLNAKALALFPTDSLSGLGSCVVATRGVLASSLAELAVSLGPCTAAFTQPAPELGPNGFTFGIPISREDRPLYLFLVQLVLPSPNDLRVHLVILQTVAGFILYREQFRRIDQLHQALERTSSFLNIFRQAGIESDSSKAERVVVDALRDYVGCSRVVFGIKKASGIRIRTVSGVSKMDGKSTRNLPYEAAMKETLTAGKRVDFAAGSRAGTHSVALEILQQRSGASHLTAVPLSASSGDFHGVMVFEWEFPPSDESRVLLEAAVPFLSALFDLMERSRVNPWVSSARNFWSQSSANRRRVLGFIVLAGVALLAFPFHYQIRADCRLVPTVKRVVASPFTGELRESLVRPGDRVIRGQKLAEMDNRDLKLHEAELIASRDRSFKQRDRAMSNTGEGPDYAAAQVAQLEGQSIDQDLQLVRRKIALLAIESPLDGVVVFGDLRRAKGVPVQQGQVLFEVAPLDEMIVEIDLPDRDVSYVRPGLPVSFRLDAFAGETWRAHLERVHPQAEQRDNRNVFICEAAVSNGKGGLDLRPGMRGRATISGDRHPLIWILTHRLWEFIVTTLFW